MLSRIGMTPGKREGRRRGGGGRSPAPFSRPLASSYAISIPFSGTSSLTSSGGVKHVRLRVGCRAHLATLIEKCAHSTNKHGALLSLVQKYLLQFWRSFGDQRSATLERSKIRFHVKIKDQTPHNSAFLEWITNQLLCKDQRSCSLRIEHHVHFLEPFPLPDQLHDPLPCTKARTLPRSSAH